MRGYSGVARAERMLTEEEIGAVQSIVMAVSAGRMGAQFRDATGEHPTAISRGNDDPDEDDGAC